jgi:hypothetical protein
MRLLVSAIAALASALALVVFLAARRGDVEPEAPSRQFKPVHEGVLHLEHSEPPPGLDGVFKDRDIAAVVRLRVQSVRGVDRTFPNYNNQGTVRELVSEYRATVTEVFKADPRIDEGTDLLFLGNSAEIDRGAFVERRIDPSFPTLTANGDYVVLLWWYDRWSAWNIIHGPYGVWDLEGGVVRCLRVSELCRSMSGWTETQFLDELRRRR